MQTIVIQLDYYDKMLCSEIGIQFAQSNFVNNENLGNA